jgi:hypothetical protein
MIFPAPHRSGPVEDAIERSRGPDSQAGYTETKRPLVIRFDDGVNVIGLHRERNDSERRAGGCGHRGGDGGEYGRPAKRRRRLPSAECDVNRIARIVFRSWPMRHVRSSVMEAWPPCPRARASPGRERDLQLSWPSCHLERATKVSATTADGCGAIACTTAFERLAPILKGPQSVRPSTNCVVRAQWDVRAPVTLEHRVQSAGAPLAAAPRVSRLVGHRDRDVR